jgi:hypothetical protein
LKPAPHLAGPLQKVGGKIIVLSNNQTWGYQRAKPIKAHHLSHLYCREALVNGKKF